MPALTLLVAAGAVLLYGFPENAPLFVYRREAILEGQLWRLASGHLVHFSGHHLVYNLLLFIPAGWWLERLSRARLAWLLGLTVLTSGVYFLLALPAMSVFGGLSGLTTACIVYLALNQFYHAPNLRALWLAMLLLVAVKILYEILAGSSLFLPKQDAPFTLVPAVHVIGALIAAGLFLLDTRGALRRHRV